MNQTQSQNKQTTHTHTCTCRNCGNLGHLYKDCPHPITSFGIICYKLSPENKIEYLMIQRKDSLCFMEFIRGKYELKNHSYIRNLLSGMTISERELLLTLSFDELWNYVWYQTSMHRQTNEYNHAKTKFETLFKGYSSSNTNSIPSPSHDSKKINLKFLIDTSITPYQNPEWGFPKGRRKIHEDDVKCAVREYTEETGIGGNQIELEKDIPPFEEIFYGTNNILYRHVYYVAKMINYDDTENIEVDPENINQAREVRAIKWLDYNDVISHIREHNTERKNLIEQVHNLIKKKHDTTPTNTNTA